MRNPVKKLKLYDAIKSDIASGAYLSGSFLPNEFELAEKYGYSRDTVRSALAMLEDNKVVELLKGRGRRICPANTPKAKVPLTFLLPCADYISETFSEDVSAQYTRRILKGFSQVAFEYDYRVESVPVSLTNSEHDIDWRKLNFINADNMLIVLGEWYSDLFPLLLERGCRTAFVDTYIVPRKSYENFVNSSFRIIINTFGAAEIAIGHLFRQGCRRIVLFHHNISVPEHPVMAGYLSGLRKYGLTFAAWHELPGCSLELQGVKSQLKDFYKKSGGFDGLIMDPNTIFDLRLHDYRELGLPDKVKVITSGDFGNNRWVTPQLTNIEFPYEDIGRIAARHLLATEFSPGEQLINGRLIECKSKSVFSKKEQLVPA